MWYVEVSAGSVIFREGDPGSCFFIITSGTVDIIFSAEPARLLRPGDGFGELLLLYEMDRPSTAVAKEKVCMWVLDRVSFKEAVELEVIRQFEENQKHLEGLSFYQFLSNQQKERVAISFVTLRYFRGQNIIEEGDPGSAFYILKEGTASLLRGGIQERKISQG